MQRFRGKESKTRERIKENEEKNSGFEDWLIIKPAEGLSQSRDPVK
ncbi:hypothetical protein QUF73_24125 [Cytobacillus sp. NJ13]|nr:hypothetical protein [Cytobacillus sp. NJ13]